MVHEQFQDLTHTLWGVAVGLPSTLGPLSPYLQRATAWADTSDTGLCLAEGLGPQQCDWHFCY